MQMNFDPITGQPINNNNNVTNINPVVPNTAEVVQQQNATQVTQVPVTNSPLNTQQQMQNIATVEQSRQDFINNTQTETTAKKEEKKDGTNIAFIIILFVIILAAILFLFPYLLNVL